VETDPQDSSILPGHVLPHSTSLLYPDNPLCQSSTPLWTQPCQQHHAPSMSPSTWYGGVDMYTAHAHERRTLTTPWPAGPSPRRFRRHLLEHLAEIGVTSLFPFASKLHGQQLHSKTCVAAWTRGSATPQPVACRRSPFHPCTHPVHRAAAHTLYKSPQLLLCLSTLPSHLSHSSFPPLRARGALCSSNSRARPRHPGRRGGG
jgi:hypothetical protein